MPIDYFYTFYWYEILVIDNSKGDQRYWQEKMF